MLYTWSSSCHVQLYFSHPKAQIGNDFDIRAGLKYTSEISLREKTV